MRPARQLMAERTVSRTCIQALALFGLSCPAWAGESVMVAALGLGFVSAVFDNIPLTALALKQGGYDWGMLAYAVGFGGSMIWFGSSAGVALSNMYPEGKSVGNWLRHGWHVALAYVVGFAVLFFTLGWQPHAPHKAVEGVQVENAAPAAATAQ